jgi:hypothetical protein
MPKVVLTFDVHVALAKRTLKMQQDGASDEHKQSSGHAKSWRQVQSGFEIQQGLQKQAAHAKL